MRNTNTPRPIPRRAGPGVAALLALFLVAAASPSARAQVQDDAGFFGSDAVTRATQTIDRIKREHGKDLRIETYPSVPSNLQADFQRLGKDPFYEQWAQQRGKTLGLDGLLVLITREPPRIQIQVGRATRAAAFPEADRKQLTDIFGTKFKEKQYDDALMDGVDFVYRQMSQNLRAAKATGGTGAAAGSGAGPGAAYPPAPGGGGGGAGTAAGPNRTSTAPPGAGKPGGLACGGGMGSLMCMVVAIIAAVMLLRGVFARRSGGYGQGPGMPPNPPYGQPGYGGGYGGGPGGGMGGGMGGGGFGRGMLGGLLGGVLGGWAFDKMGGRSHDAGAAGMGGAAGGLPPTDPSTLDTGSSGADFGGGGGADFGGGGSDFGGGGGGDSGSSGSDF